MPLLLKFLRDSRAATSIEYAMIATLISIVIISGATSIGSLLKAKFLGPVSNGLT